MMTKRWMLTLALAGVLAIGAVACGDDDDDGDAATPTRAAATAPATGAASPTPAVTTDATAAATEPAGGETLAVTAADFSFAPAELTAPAGSVTIALTNSGSAPHTLTLYSDAAFTQQVPDGDTGQISGGASGEFTADLDAGDYFFRCLVHPGAMQGGLTVE